MTDEARSEVESAMARCLAAVEAAAAVFARQGLDEPATLPMMRQLAMSVQCHYGLAAAE
jgi:hypothetical protein